MTVTIEETDTHTDEDMLFLEDFDMAEVCESDFDGKQTCENKADYLLVAKCCGRSALACEHCLFRFIHWFKTVKNPFCFECNSHLNEFPFRVTSIK